MATFLLIVLSWADAETEEKAISDITRMTDSLVNNFIDKYFWLYISFH